MVTRAICCGLSGNLRPFVKEELRPLVEAFIKITHCDVSFSRIPELAYKDIFIGKVQEIPSDLSVIPTWEECCDREALKLLEISKTQEVVISWSGGIDSTVIIAALLKNSYDKTIHNVKVYATNESVKEYPWFFYKLIIPNFDVLITTPSEIIKTGTSILVTGEPGDQLFGSALCLEMMGYYGNDVSQLDYTYIADSLAERHGNYGILFWNHYKDIVNYAPFQIKTVEQFWWWWNFTQKWNHVLYRTLLSCEDPSNGANMYSFFASDDFQKWAINNAYINTLSKTRTEHKMVAKEYIVGYTGEESYLKKVKYPSLARGGVFGYLNYCIDENFQKGGPKYFLTDYWKL